MGLISHPRKIGSVDRPISIVPNSTVMAMVFFVVAMVFFVVAMVFFVVAMMFSVATMMPASK